MKKRIMIFCLTAVMLLSFSGCKKNADDSSRIASIVDEEDEIMSPEELDEKEKQEEQKLENDRTWRRSFAKEVLETDTDGDMHNPLIEQTPVEEMALEEKIPELNTDYNYMPLIEEYREQLEQEETPVAENEIQEYIDNQLNQMTTRESSVSNFVQKGDVVNVSFVIRNHFTHEVMYDYVSYDIDTDDETAQFAFMIPSIINVPIGSEFSIGVGTKAGVVFEGYYCNVQGVVNYIEGNYITEYGEKFFQAASQGKCTTEDEYREYVRSILAQEKRPQTRSEFLEELVQNSGVDDSIFQEQISLLFEKKKNIVASWCDAQHISVEEYAKTKGKSEEELYDAMEQELRNLVKMASVISYIASHENFEFDIDIMEKASENFFADNPYYTAPHEYLTTHTPEELRYVLMIECFQTYFLDEEEFEEQPDTAETNVNPDNSSDESSDSEE